jgi:hypothetical protein
MHPNYRNQQERSARAALPGSILSNRPGTAACAVDSLDEAVMH